MSRSRHPVVAVLVVAAILGAAAPARAEWFAGLYLGWANTSKTELTFTTRSPRTFEDVEFDNSVVGGARAGYWFGPQTFEGLGEIGRNVGVDLDLSYFNPRIPSQFVDTNIGRGRLGFMDIDVVTITPSLLLRYPLMVDKEFPAGRLQPYVGIGPTIYVASTTDSGTFGGRGDEETDTGLGVSFRPGIAWHVTESVALFAEYRLIHFSPDYGFRRGPVDFSITSHHLNFGATFTFGR